MGALDIADFRFPISDLRWKEWEIWFTGEGRSKNPKACLSGLDRIAFP